MTDLHPVFLEADEEPAGFVLTHTLKVDYYKEGDIHGMEVVLTDQDLAILVRTLERATTKSASLRQTLQRAEVALFDLVEE